MDYTTSADFPKTRKENLIWRTEMLRRCSNDLSFRARMKELFHRNILFAFNAFYYTYDPRKRPRHQIPFMTWEFQDEAILQLQEAIRTGEDLLIEKSRDMGASWMALLTCHHGWIDPEGGADFLFGSRIEDYVDKKGDMRTLFEKVRYAHYKLPRWLWPKGFNPRKHDNFMKFQNPETGAIIGGESNNPNFSTGGRYAAVIFDEFGKWEGTDVAAWTSAGDASPCRVPISTPFGAAGKYYDLVTDGKTKRLRLHWSLHPEKGFALSCIWPPPNEADKGQLGEHWTPEEKLTSPWYEKECMRRTPDEIAQEIDIDYIGAGNPVFNKKAAESLKFYMKVPDEPILWGELDLTSYKVIERLDAPRSWEDFLVVYTKYNPKHCYALGVDVVEGVEGGDYAVIRVLDRITKDVVAGYFSRIDEVLLAKIIKTVSDYYAPEPDSSYAPWTGIETIGPGLATFDICMLMGMTNLFMAPRYDVVNGGVSYKKGFRTDNSSRNELVAGVRDYLIHRKGKLNSQRLVGEMLKFVRSKTGKPQAKEGAHDDEIFAFGIPYKWMRLLQ